MKNYWQNLTSSVMTDDDTQNTNLRKSTGYGASVGHPKFLNFEDFNACIASKNWGIARIAADLPETLVYRNDLCRQNGEALNP